MGIAQTTVLVNEWREESDTSRPRISWHAVQGFSVRCEALITRKRGTKKSGSRDEASDWARARLAQCVQLQRQFELGLKDEEGGTGGRGGTGRKERRRIKSENPTLKGGKIEIYAPRRPMFFVSRGLVKEITR